MVGLFLQNENSAAKLAVQGFPYFAIGFSFFILNLTIIGYFQSLERIKPATFFALLRGCVFLIPAFSVIIAFYALQKNVSQKNSLELKLKTVFLH